MKTKRFPDVSVYVSLILTCRITIVLSFSRPKFNSRFCVDFLALGPTVLNAFFTETFRQTLSVAVFTSPPSIVIILFTIRNSIIGQQCNSIVFTGLHYITCNIIYIEFQMFINFFHSIIANLFASPVLSLNCLIQCLSRSSSSFVPRSLPPNSSNRAYEWPPQTRLSFLYAVLRFSSVITNSAFVLLTCLLYTSRCV